MIRVTFQMTCVTHQVIIPVSIVYKAMESIIWSVLCVTWLVQELA